MTATPTPTQYEIRDGKRIIRFTGTLISTASSERPHAPRFVTLSLFSLPSPPPSYVLQRIGHSNVFHTSNCRQAERNHLPYGHEISSLTDDDLSPCPYCTPRRPTRSALPTPLPSDFLTTHRFETPRHFGAICDTPDDLIRVLSTQSPHSHPSASTIPWLSRTLLDTAVLTDSRLQAAYDITIP